jgi:hypothetical protein
MSPRIAADDGMAKTFIATFRLDGPYRDIVHPDLRSLTHNPVSLIGKDPYIVAMRLEQGRF